MVDVVITSDLENMMSVAVRAPFAGRVKEFQQGAHHHWNALAVNGQEVFDWGASGIEGAIIEHKSRHGKHPVSIYPLE